MSNPLQNHYFARQTNPPMDSFDFETFIPLKMDTIFLRGGGGVGDSMGFVWGGVGRALEHFMHFSPFFGMLVVLATSVTPCYPL